MRPLSREASPAEVAKKGQQDNNDDDDPQQGHLHLLFSQRRLTLRLGTRVASGQNSDGAQYAIGEADSRNIGFSINGVE